MQRILMFLRVEMKSHYRSVPLSIIGRYSKKSRRKRSKRSNFYINYATERLYMRLFSLKKQKQCRRRADMIG